MEALGVYIFAGGFSLGVKAAGFDVVAHFEEFAIDEYYDTCRNLLPGIEIYRDRVIWPTKKYRGIPFVFCNPPCAIWSVAGASMGAGKTNWLRDPRTSCIRDTMRALKEIRPKVLVWESVTQAWTRGRGLLRQLEREGLQLGYHVTYLFTSAELHGIPQPRFRFLMCFHKVALDFPTPDTPYRNIGDVLRLVDLGDGRWGQLLPVWGEPTIHPGYLELMKCLKPNEGIREVAHDLDFPGSPPFMAHRLQRDGRGKTLTSAVMEVHPVFPRWIANSEVAALGGWPTDERLYVGDVASVRAQLTQAVLPPVGEYIGRCVRRALENDITPEGSPGVNVVSHIREERPSLG